MLVHFNKWLEKIGNLLNGNRKLVFTYKIKINDSLWPGFDCMSTCMLTGLDKWARPTNEGHTRVHSRYLRMI